MRRLELVRALLRNETSILRVLALGDAKAAREFGAGFATRGGVACTSARAFPIALLHRAIGFGSLVRADQSTLDQVVRHYKTLGLPARVELDERVAPAIAARLLERNGFAREEFVHHVHVLEAASAPRPVTIGGLTIDRVTARTAKSFGAATARGFAVEGTPLGEFFDRVSVAAVRTATDRVAAFLPRVDGEIAGTGMAFLSPGVCGLYSGSVFEPFRGRGIQNALIAERVRFGLSRRRRIFVSQTEGDNPSSHNLREMGFRHLYTATFYLKPTA
ncbi:MAG: hypothetical protein HY071_00160 [Chloroflexi bacterium]|nr:hypothetical protein [Chloroflexota bacterium]